MSNAVVLAIVGLISVASFLNGLRFARMTVNPWTGKSVLGQPVEGGEMSIERVNLIGKMQMIGAPIFFLLFVGVVVFGGVEFRA